MMDKHKESEKSLEEQIAILEMENARLCELVNNLENPDKAMHMPGRAPRIPINTPIEFIGDFDILEAEGVNYSDGGICFELHSPLIFEMQFRINDVLHSHRAELMWVAHLDNNHSRLGLKFVPFEKEPLFPRE
jgi:hypothetical protein